MKENKFQNSHQKDLKDRISKKLKEKSKSDNFIISKSAKINKNVQNGLTGV